MGKLIGEEDFLARYVTWALWLLAIIVCAATVTGLVESYNGLYIWFATHGIAGFWADYAPLMVDSFTVVGELAIFAGISRHWEWKSRILPWLSAFVGIAASVAGNVGDKIGHALSWELTAAVPPLAGAFGIVIGLGVLKRVAKDWSDKHKKKPEGLTSEQIAIQIEEDRKHLTDTLNKWKDEGKMDPPPRSEVVAGPSIETMERVQAANAERAAQGAPAPRPRYPSDEELKDRVHVGEPVELKGMDVLIPPKPPVETWPNGVAVGTQTAATVAPMPVSREEARRRLSDLRPGRQIIQPDGLDPHVTGSFPAIPADA